MDIPEPRPFVEHQKDEGYAGVVLAFVEIDIARHEGKAEEINITLPRRLLVRIDEYAAAHDYTRSGFLAEAARKLMRRGRPRGRRQKGLRLSRT